MKPLEERVYLAFILILGLVLRLYGISFGLPDLFHADEPIVVNHALAYGTFDFNPHFFRIPPLTSYVLFGIYGLYFVVGRLFGTFSSVETFEHLFYSDPTSFYLIGRVCLGAILGVVTLFVLYRLIKKHFSAEHGILSALFLAVCFLHVRDSHYIYADIPLVLTLIVAMGVFWRHLDGHQSWRDHMMSGAMIGLAAAVKYNGVFIVFPYLTLVILSSRKNEGVRNTLIAALSSIVVFIGLNPFSVLDFGFFLQEMVGETQVHQGVRWSKHLSRSLLGAVGLPLLVFSVIGISRKETWISPKRITLAIFILVYYFVVMRWGQPYARYVLPLLPFVIFFAADATLQLFRLYAGWPKWIYALSVLLLTIVPLTKSYRVGKLLTASDVRTIAAMWIEKHIPEGAKIALDSAFYMPRLELEREELITRKDEMIESDRLGDPRMRKLNYLLSHHKGGGYGLFEMRLDPEESPSFLFEKKRIAYDLDVLRNEGVEYVVTSQVHERSPMSNFYKRLEQEGHLVARISPYRNFRYSYPLQPVITGAPFDFEDLWYRQRNGQPLKVYKI